MWLRSRRDPLERVLMLKRSLLMFLASLVLCCVFVGAFQTSLGRYSGFSSPQLFQSCWLRWYSACITHLTAGLLVLVVTAGFRVQETRVVSRRQLYSLDTAACYCNTGYLGWRWSLVRLSFSLSSTVQALTFLKDAKIYKKWTTRTSTRRSHWIIY